MEKNKFRCSACNEVRSTTNSRWREMVFGTEIATVRVCRSCSAWHPAPSRYNKLVTFRVTPTEYATLCRRADQDHEGGVSELIRSLLFG